MAAGLVNHNRPLPPRFFVSVDSRRFSILLSSLESTLVDISQVLILMGLELH